MTNAPIAGLSLGDLQVMADQYRDADERGARSLLQVHRHNRSALAIELAALRTRLRRAVIDELIARGCPPSMLEHVASRIAAQMPSKRA